MSQDKLRLPTAIWAILNSAGMPVITLLTLYTILFIEKVVVKCNQSGNCIQQS